MKALLLVLVSLLILLGTAAFADDATQLREAHDRVLATSTAPVHLPHSASSASLAASVSRSASARIPQTRPSRERSTTHRSQLRPTPSRWGAADERRGRDCDDLRPAATIFWGRTRAAEPCRSRAGTGFRNSL